MLGLLLATLYKWQTKPGVETLESAIWTRSHTEPAPRYSNETAGDASKQARGLNLRVASVHLFENVFKYSLIVFYWG